MLALSSLKSGSQLVGIFRSGTQATEFSFFAPTLVTFLPQKFQIIKSVIIIKKSYPRNRPWRPIGLRDVENPTLS
jgi:hypothetical protein